MQYYGTIDAGYDWLRGFGYKIAPFVGYNAFNQRYEDMKAFGCIQPASPFSDCVPPIAISVLGITEKNTWQSIRFGAAADFYCVDVWFNGTGNHVLRSLVSAEDGHRQGVKRDLSVS